MNEDAKWLYEQLTALGYGLGTQDEYAKTLSNEEDLEWYYETATSNGLGVGSYDEFKNGLGKSTVKTEDEIKREALQQARDTIKKLKEKKENQNSPSPYSASSDFDRVEEGQKRQEEEREKREKIENEYKTIGLTESDIDLSKKITVDKTVSKANESLANFNPLDVTNAPVPQINEFGIIEYQDKSEVEAKKEKEKNDPLLQNIISNVPSYLTRGEETQADIQLNAIERAQNTQGGAELWNTMLNKAIEEFKGTDEYKTLVEKYKVGEATEEDINKLFNEKYVSTVYNNYWQEISKDGGIMQNYIDVATEKSGMKNTAISTNILDAKLDDAIDNAINEYMDKYEETIMKNPVVSEYSNPFSLETIDRPLYSAKGFNDETKELIDAVINNKGFGKGVWGTAKDIDTWDLGMGELTRNVELLSVIEKLEKNPDYEPTHSEKLLLDAATNYFAASAYYSKKLGRGYKAGQTSMASIPFMIQFVVSSGTISAINAGAKTAVKGANKRIIKHLLKHGRKKLAVTATNAVSGLVGSAANAALMTATYGSLHVASGTAQRMTGQLIPEWDKETKTWKYEGREYAQSAGEAFGNSLAENFIENFSEMALANTLSPIGAYMEGTGLFRYISKNNFVGTIMDIRKNPAFKALREKTQFSGYFGEVAEEYFGGILRLATMSDVNNLQQAGLDLDGQIDIFLGLAPTSLLFGGYGAVRHYGGIAIDKKKVRDSLTSEAEKELFDELMSESRSGQFGDIAHNFLRDVITNPKMSNEDKREAFIGVAQQYRDLLSQELQTKVSDVYTNEVEKEVNKILDIEKHKTDNCIYETKDDMGRTLVIVDGNVATSQSEGTTIIDTEKSSDYFIVRYINANNTLSDAEKISAKNLTMPVIRQTIESSKEYLKASYFAKENGENTFEANGYVYNTADGSVIATAEEYKKQQEKKQTQDELTNEPKVSTKSRHFSGTFDVKIDGKNHTVRIVSTIDSPMTQNEDGSIKSGEFSISVDGNVIRSKERKQIYIDAVSEKMKADHAQAVEKYNANNKPVEQEPLLSPEDRAARERELAKKAVIESMPRDKKTGEIKMEELTPEQTVVAYMQEETPDGLIQLLTDQLQYINAKTEEINSSKTMSPIEKRNKTRKFINEAKEYEAAIAKWLGEDALTQITSAPVQEVAPIQVVAEQAAPVVEQAPVQEAPVEQAPVEEVTEEAPVEDEAEEVTEEIEPVDLSGEDIEFVKQAHRVEIARRGEDGVLRFLKNGKPVKEDKWMPAAKIKVWYNGQPCYVLTTATDVSGLNNQVNVVAEQFTGNINKISKYDITDEAGNRLVKTGTDIQRERVEKYKSVDDFFNAIIYADAQSGIRLTLKELLDINPVNDNKGKGRNAIKLPVEQFIRTKAVNRDAVDVRNEIKKHLQELIDDWNVYVKLNNIVADESSMSPFFEAMIQEGGYSSNMLTVQANDYTKLNSLKVSENPLLQLAIVLDQAYELGLTETSINMMGIDIYSSVKSGQKKQTKAQEEKAKSQEQETKEPSFNEKLTEEKKQQRAELLEQLEMAEDMGEHTMAQQLREQIAAIDIVLQAGGVELMVDEQVQESRKAAKVIINLLKKAGVRVIEVTEQQIEQMVGSKEYKKLTADGVVYGAAHKGIIYLNSDHLNPNTPLHEFTHLWVDWYKKEFKEEWERFVKLAVKSKIAKQLKTKEAYKSLNDSDLASEVLSRYTGYTYGALNEEEKSEFENLMNEAGSIEEQIAEKPLVKAIREFWKKIISIFDKTVLEVKEEEAIDEAIREFANKPMQALISGEFSAENLDNSEKNSNFAANNKNYETNDQRRVDGEISSGSRRGARGSNQTDGRFKSSHLWNVARTNGGYDANVAEEVGRISAELSKALDERGIKHTSQSIRLAEPQEFYDAIIEAKKLNPHGWMVDAYSAEDYAGFTCFLTEDGKSGIAVKPNGDIISVFSSVNRDSRLQMLMPMAIIAGGRKLDCYYLQDADGNIQGLPRLYSMFGFKVAATTNFVEEYVPQDEYKRWQEDNNGKGIQGVAAMYISEESSLDVVDAYNAGRVPNTNAENFESADTGYGEALSTRDKLQVVEDAKFEGTYMQAPNGMPSKLTESQWAEVRTDAFKYWFGDWQNDTSNASVVLDENGEPMITYHGSRMAGFDTFGRGIARDSQGIYTTDNRRAAESYATSVEEWKSEQTMPEAEIGTPDQHGVYSLYVNMRNPKVIDFGGKRFDEYGETKYEVATNEALDNGERGILFDTLEEAEAYIAEHPEEDLDYVEKRTTSDDLLVEAKEEGYDGVIFTNIIDSRYPDPITNYVPFNSNQVKSATQNIGTFNAEDDRIQFMVSGGSSSKAKDPELIESEVIKRIQVKSIKYMATIANPRAQIPDEFDALNRAVATMLDRTEGIRLLMDRIAKYRKEHGMSEMGEGYDVRTMVEAMDSKIANQTRLYVETKENELRKCIYNLAKKVKKSDFYKKYKKEQVKKQNGKDSILTPREIIERYLIAEDSIEREKLNGNPRGVRAFAERMGVDMVQYRQEFLDAFANTPEGAKEIEKLWDAIRGVTGVVISEGERSGLISKEDAEVYRKRKFYVPERDFAEVEANDDLQVDDNGFHGRVGNKLMAIQKAEGGETLAANVLANMTLLARDAIVKANKNIVKKAMYDLLRENEDWCRENNVPIPNRVWYVKDEKGNIKKQTDAPSQADQNTMRELKTEVRKREEEIANERELIAAEQDEAVRNKRLATIEEIQEEIDGLRAAFPYLDEFDTRDMMFFSRATQKEFTVTVFIDGVPCEMHFPNMTMIANALNGKFDKRGEAEWLKKFTSALSASMTVYNPAFFAVNVVRDIPFIMTKGYVEHGWKFPIKFTWQLAQKAFTWDVWRVVATGDYTKAKNPHIREFFEGGGNTGYSTIPDIDKLKKAANGWDKKTSISWQDLGDVLSYLNSMSEVWTRLAAYSAVRSLNGTQEDGVRAAKNLSVNFNRRGLGHPIMNTFNSISFFANAAIQGASGFYRAFYTSKKDTKGKFAQTFRAIGAFMFGPAILGYIATILTPDDDKELLWYSDYDRDNYFIYGEGRRIPLNEQLKPFWVIGVNIALVTEGRRTMEQALNSVMTAFFTNLVPAAPNINSSLTMITNALTGTRDFNTSMVIENMIVPQAMSNISDISHNVSFMGSKLRYEMGDFPEYLLGENEAVLYRAVAEMFYDMAGGDKDLPSKHVEVLNEDGTISYEKMHFLDKNPREIEAFMSIGIPSTFRDFANLAVGVAKDDYGKITDYTTVKRFYNPRDKEMTMYQIVRQAKDIVKDYDEQMSNYKKQLAGAAISDNQAKEDKAYARIKNIVGNGEVEVIKSYVDAYESMTMYKYAKQFGMTEEQFIAELEEKYPEKAEAFKKLNGTPRDEMARKILTLTREFKGIEVKNSNLK